MNILTLSPQFANLRIEAGEHESSETRLDLRCWLRDSNRLVDRQSTDLGDSGCSLRIYDASGSIRAESLQHGIGSVRYRPPSPNGLAGDCVIQANLPSAAFANLLALCLAGHVSRHFHLTLDEVKYDPSGALVWDKEAIPCLTVLSISAEANLPLVEESVHAVDA